jgi:hypothetical protein
VLQDTEDNGDDGSVWLSILFGAVLFASIIGTTLFIILKPLAAKVSFLGIPVEQKICFRVIFHFERLTVS